MFGDQTNGTPRAFLSYTSNDAEFAKRIAETLHAKGIETWWDKWCIYPGDSLRQKIDEGLADCTHFLVLLTPDSIRKPWVNQEMDAALVRKLEGQCKFLPLLHKVLPSDLPPLLAGMYAPSIISDEDISQLVGDIYGVSRKPALGAPPASVTNSLATTGYSPAATAIARLFVEQTKCALRHDPYFEVKDLARAVDLTVEDAEDAIQELSGYIRESHGRALVEEALFAEFDRHWMPWNTETDALRLATDIVNDKNFPHDPRDIAQRYEWPPRRLNPAITFLTERGLIVDYKLQAYPEFTTVRVLAKPDMRRYVKSRI